MSSSAGLEDNSKYLLEDNQRAILSGYIVLAIPIFVANVWVSLAILFSKRLRHSTTNYLVLGLPCGGDLLVLFTRIPISVIGFLHDGGWPDEIPQWSCTVLAGLDASNGINTWTILLLIAINRWMKTCKSPQLYHRVFNVWSTCSLLMLVWIVKFVFAALPPIIGFGSYGYSQSMKLVQRMTITGQTISTRG